VRNSDRTSVAFISTSPALPRLLLGAGPDTVGGAELQLVFVAKALARRGWDVHVAMADYGQPIPDRTADGIALHTVYRASRTYSSWRRLLRPIQLLASMRRIPADVCVSMGAGAQGGVMAALCRTQRRRCVFWLACDTDATCHVEDMSRMPRRDRWLALRGLRWAHDIVAQSHQQRDLLRHHVGRDAVILPYVWPFEIAMRQAEEPRYALWVSNIRPKKRPELLLDIAERLPEIQFVMIGGSVRGHEGLYDRIRERADGLPNVRFMGYVPFEQVQGFFERAAVFVNTSAVEGFPNTYLQAWSSGKPVICSFDPDGLIERVGMGVEFVEAEDGAARLADIWSDPTTLRRMGERAVCYVREHHTEDALIALLEEVLRPL